MCFKFLYHFFFSVLIYFNKCVVTLEMHTKTYMCTFSCKVVSFSWCVLEFKVCCAPLMSFTISLVHTQCLGIQGNCCIYLGVVFWAGLFGSCKMDCYTFSSSLLLQLFKFGLDSPDNRSPFSFVQSPCLHLFTPVHLKSNLISSIHLNLGFPVFSVFLTCLPVTSLLSFHYPLFSVPKPFQST